MVVTSQTLVVVGCLIKLLGSPSNISVWCLQLCSLIYCFDCKPLLSDCIIKAKKVTLFSSESQQSHFT